MRRLWLILPVLALLGCASATSTSATVPKARLAATAAGLPPIRHVFTIILENESASTTFGPHPPAPYLAKTLTSEGAYLPKYYGTGHASNDNYISMISGQPPNALNEADCQTFSDFSSTATGKYGVMEGPGCVYPAGVHTVANQLDAKRADLARLQPEHGQHAEPRVGRVWAPGRRLDRPHAVGDGPGRVRHPARPVRVFPLDHRRHDAVR